MTMYALCLSDGRTEMVGKVLSLHRTLEAASAANDKLQRLTRRANHSESCWVETRIAQPSKRPSHPAYVNLDEIEFDGGVILRFLVYEGEADYGVAGLVVEPSK